MQRATRPGRTMPCTASQAAHSSPFGAGLSAPRCHAPPTPPSGRGRAPAGSTLKRAASTRRSAEPLRPRFRTVTSPRNRRLRVVPGTELLGPESQIYLQKFDLSVLPANCEKNSRKSDKGQELARNASTRTPGEEIFDKSAFTLLHVWLT